MTNPLSPYLTPLLTGENLVAPGKLSTIFKVDDGLEIHFHNDIVARTVQRKSWTETHYHKYVGTIVKLVWEILVEYHKNTDITDFHIYYVGNTVKFRWGVVVPSVKFEDPYKKVKENIAARERAIEKRRYGGRV